MKKRIKKLKEINVNKIKKYININKKVLIKINKLKYKKIKK